MSNKDVPKYLTSPVLGLSPFLIYLLIYHFTRKVDCGLTTMLFLAVLFEISIYKYTKTKACGMMFRVTFFASAITLSIWIFFRNASISDHVFSIIFEAFVVCLLILIDLLKGLINRYYNGKNVLQKMFFNDFFVTAHIIQYVFTIHIFFLFIVRYFEHVNISLESDAYFIWIPFISILLLAIKEFLKMSIVISKLQKEEWLPIVTERGDVTGRIARSVSLEMKDQYLHPVVRIALIHRNYIYLQARVSDEPIDSGKLDHPFKKNILFKEDIDLAARNCICKILNYENFSFKFSLKYIFESTQARRLIFLYVARIEDEDQLKNMNLKGKFWTTQQIEANMSDGIFSRYFQQEYEYLKNTVLRLGEIKDIV